MSRITTELEAIESYIKTIYPTYEIDLQKVPKKPTPNSFVISFQRGTPETETGYSFRNDREFQVVYFGTDIVDTLNTMGDLQNKVYDDLLIPLNDGSLRYLRLGSFSLSQPFETENGLDAIIGVLEASVRQARGQEHYEKIQSVYARYTSRIELE